MSREQFQRHIANTGGHIDKVVVGAAIIRQNDPPAGPRATGPQLLLLKRSPTENYYPNVFEMPGGNVDSTDATIRDALVREVMEETGLVVTRILDQLPSFIYTTEKVVKVSGGQKENILKKCIQLSFVVLVDGEDFRVNPEEHSTGSWATKEMLLEMNITEDMRRIVSVALDRQKNYSR